MSSLYDFILSTKQTYPLVLLVATCLKACVDFRIQWDASVKDRTTSPNKKSKQKPTTTTTNSRTPAPFLYSMVLGLIGYAQAGSFCTNLIFLASTPTIFLSNTVIPVYLLCWLTVNHWPMDMCFELLQNPLISFVLDILSSLDSATAALNAAVKAHVMRPNAIYLPILTGTFNPLAGKFVRCLDQKLSGQTCDSELSRPSATFYLAFANAVILCASDFSHSAFVALACWMVCARLAVSVWGALCWTCTSERFSVCTRNVRTLFSVHPVHKKVE